MFNHAFRVLGRPETRMAVQTTGYQGFLQAFFLGGAYLFSLFI